jgi:hypothetical protein
MLTDHADGPPCDSFTDKSPIRALQFATCVIHGTLFAMVIARAERRVSAFYGVRHFVRDGGLISYGPDILGLVRCSASYVDRVLSGSVPQGRGETGYISTRVPLAGGSGTICCRR